MPNGRLTRRTRPRIARGFVVLIVALAACAGCQRFPLRYAEVTPESTSKATTRVERAKGDPGPPAAVARFLAENQTAAPTQDEAQGSDSSGAIEPAPDLTPGKPGPAPARQPSATPLIDQALRRASALPDPEGEAPRPLKADPAGAEAAGAEAPLELPPANETPAKDEGAALEAKPGSSADVTAAIPKEFEPAPDVKVKEPGPLDVVPEPADGKASRSTPGPVSKPIDVEKPAETPAETDEWREGLKRVRELALRRAGEPGDTAPAWAIRSRVLDWLAGEGPDPAGETGRVWNSVLATLSTATGPETPDEPTLAYHLGAAVEALESYAPIQITALSFCRKIDGFGHYEPIESPSVRTGQPLLVYCEMSGLRYESDDSGFRSRLSSQVDVLPAGGGAVVWSEALGTAEDLCRRRRRDYFVNYRIVVPARLAPGSYSLRLSQTDLVSNRSVSASVPFTVRP